jgi:AcrR family transcriptional regulator
VIGRLACFSVDDLLEWSPVGVRGVALEGVPPAEQGCPGDCWTCGRLRGAVLDALAEGGLESLTAAGLERRAGVRARALAAHYGTLDTCLVATYDEVSEGLYRRMVEAFSGPGDWHMRLARAVEVTLDQTQSAPGIGRLCFGEATHRHVRIGALRAASRQRVVRFLAAEYEDDQGHRLPEVHFEFLFGALMRTAQDEMTAGREPAVVAARVRELVALLEPVPA